MTPKQLQAYVSLVGARRRELLRDNAITARMAQAEGKDFAKYLEDLEN
jgi:hypothetical protein